MPVEIHYSIGMVAQERRRHGQAERLNEFRNSFCDAFDSRDLHFYAAETGKDIHWLVDHAKWRDPRGMLGCFLERALCDKDLDLIDEFFLGRF